MKVLVNGTVKELEIKDANGIDWTEDALDVSNNDGFTYNDGEYECSEETFEDAKDYLEKIEESYNAETGLYEYEA